MNSSAIVPTSSRTVASPMKPTSSWTFALALALLRAKPEGSAVQAMDEFLTQNKTILLLPQPFACLPKTDVKTETSSVNGVEFTLRGITYSGVTSEDRQIASKICDLLKIEQIEVLRVIVQSKARNPTLPAPLYKLLSVLSRLPDDSALEVEKLQISMYIRAILTERKNILCLLIECFNSRFEDSLCIAARKIGNAVVSDNEYILAAIDTLDEYFNSQLKESVGSVSEIISSEESYWITHLLKFLYEIILSQGLGHKSAVEKWFGIMQKTNFARSLGPHVSEREPFLFLKSLCTIISLQLLQLSNDIPKNNANSYLSDPTSFKIVHEAIMLHSSIHIVQYAWLLLSHKKLIVLEEFSQENSDFIKAISLAQVQTWVYELREKLHDAPVFQDIMDLHRVLAFDDIFTIPLCNLISLALPVITLNDEIALCMREVFSSAPDFCVEQLFSNPEAIRHITLARAKFPYSFCSFLSLAAINGRFAYDELKNLKSYMYSLGLMDPIVNYEIDSDNTDLIKLTSAIDVLPPYEGKNPLSLSFEVETKAKVIDVDDMNTSVAIFFHNYNGWAFLGRVVENISKSFDADDDEKISVLYNTFVLLRKVCEQTGPQEILSLLEYMSTYTDDSDIFDVIVRLLEQCMHNRFVELSEKILHVLVSLVKVIPQRVWAYLAASSLLDHRGKEGLISVLFGSVELKRGSYDFSLALTQLISALAENCLSSISDFPESSKSDILAGLVKHLTFVLEKSVSCKFNDILQKFELGVQTLNVFTKILETVYCIASDLPSDSKPTRVFSGAADTILEAFVNTDTNEVCSAGLIFQLFDFVACPDLQFEARDPSAFLLDLWIESAFSFSQLLVTVRSVKVHQLSFFEKRLYQSLPRFISIYLANVKYKKSVLSLLSALMASSYNENEAPLMLSHLGPEGSRKLLHSLATDLENAFDDYAVKIAIYDFICAMIESKQQGLSVLLIGGQDVFRDLSLPDTKIVSLLAILKKNVNDMAHYPCSVTVHLLDAIALALNSWTSAKDNGTPQNSEADLIFIKQLISKIRAFETPKRSDPKWDAIDASYECKVISKIAEILSLVFFTTKNVKCEKTVIEFLSDESLIKKLPSLFQISDYNTSIYGQAHALFEAQFSGYKLSQFTNAIKKRNRFAADAVFNLKIMDSLFGANPEWPALRQNIVNCSTNIQYFLLHISCHKAFGALLTTLCRRAPREVVSAHFKFVPQLLTIDDPVDGYTEHFIEQQHFERVELAFYLCYSINNNLKIEKDPTTAISILNVCVDTLKKSTKRSFNELHKSLLRICFLALSNLDNSSDFISTNFTIFEDFFHHFIAKGTTNIIIELQNDVYLSRTRKQVSELNGKLDYLRLILSILKLLLSFQMIPSSRAKLLNYLSTEGTIDGLRSLYSFSHLILVNDDPVFAQLSLMFIQQLMFLEQFMLHFLDRRMFLLIRESVISQPLRKGGINIENAPQLHQNWTNGILPILVTCLSKGQHVNEVLLTLEAFSKQIEYCVDLWSRDSLSLKVSTACVIETSQILYIYRFLSNFALLQQFVASSPSDVDMPFVPGLETQQKRDDFVNFVGNLLKHPKFLVLRVVPSSAEERALFKTKDDGFFSFVDNLIDEIGNLKELII